MFEAVIEVAAFEAAVATGVDTESTHDAAKEVDAMAGVDIEVGADVDVVAGVDADVAGVAEVANACVVVQKSLDVALDVEEQNSPEYEDRIDVRN